MGGPAKEWDIVLEEESEFNLDVTYYSGDKTAKNISGYGAVFQIRTRRKSNATSLYRVTHNSSDLNIAGSSGQIFVTIPEDDVTAIRTNYPDFEKGAWDLVIFPTPNTPDIDAERLGQGDAYYSDAVATLP